MSATSVPSGACASWYPLARVKTRMALARWALLGVICRGSLHAAGLAGAGDAAGRVTSEDF